MKKVLRATTVANKQDRVDVILEAAGAIVLKHGYLELTMDKLAKDSKLSKGSLYTYFKTKEEVLLSLLKQDFAAWFQGVSVYLDQCEQPFGDQFIQVWIYSLEQNPRLAYGLSYLHLFLETNISIEFAKEWKFFLLRGLEGLHYQILQKFGPVFSIDILAEYFVAMTAMTSGLWMQSHSSKQITKVYNENEELQILKTNFSRQMFDCGKALLQSEKYRILFELKKNN